MKQPKYFVEFTKGQKEECTMDQIMSVVCMENIDKLIKEMASNGSASATLPTNPNCSINKLIKEVKLYAEW